MFANCIMFQKLHYHYRRQKLITNKLICYARIHYRVLNPHIDIKGLRLKAQFKHGIIRCFFVLLIHAFIKTL